MGSQRYGWIDRFKIAAAFAVVLIHLCAPIVLKAPVDSADWLIAAALDTLAHWCVPVFVMISGAMLLPQRPDETPLLFLSKRAGRIALPFLFWHLLYIGLVAYQTRHFSHPPGIEAYWSAFWHGTSYYHLWFLWMITGLYLLTPFLRAFIRDLGEGALWSLTAAGFAVAALESFVRTALGMGPRPAVLLFLPYLPYFLAGHLLMRTADRLPPRAMAALAVAAGGVTTGALIALAPLFPIAKLLYLMDYLSPGIILLSLGLFAFVLRTTSAEASPPYLRRIADATLGVYLLHPLLLAALPQNTVGGVLLLPTAAAVFALGTALSLLLGRIPYLRRVA